MSDTDAYNLAVLMIQNDVTAGLQNLDTLCKRGHHASMYTLGLLLAQGFDGDHQKLHGMELLQQAVHEHNCPASAYMLGTLYHNNSSAMAIKYYEKAAGQGHVLAQYELGKVYIRQANRNARGGPSQMRLYQLAVETLTNAGTWGHAKAQYHLGLIYTHGQFNVKRNVSLGKVNLDLDVPSLCES